MKKKTKIRLTTYFCLYLLVGVFLYLYQKKLIYFPVKKSPHQYEVLWVNKSQTAVYKINEEEDKAIIYFGGNGEDPVMAARELSSIFPQHALYIMVYRGYGESKGEPDEEGFYQDAQELYDKIITRYGSLSLIGKSLGTGVAVDLCSKRKVNKCVLITPYDSIQSLAQSRVPLYPMSMVLTEKYRSIDKVAQITSPIYILYAGQDKIIPNKHTDRLIAQIANKEVHFFPQADHNDIAYDANYKKILKNLFEN